MVTFICLFFPALVSLFIYDKLNNKPLSRRNTVFLYSLFCLLINGACFAFKTLVLGTGNYLLAEGSDMTPSAALNYLIMAGAAAIIFAFIVALTSKNVKIEKTDKND